MSSVLDLPARIAALPEAARRRADALLSIEVVRGRTDPPPEMDDWLTRHFGSVDAVREQSIVRITNRVTLAGSLFSPLRGRRPIAGGLREAYGRLIESTRGDPFCDAERQTPADSWGRVRGRHAITGANAAMYDAHNGVMVFDEHDPLAFDADRVVDMFQVGREWAERSRQADATAVNYLLIWNNGPRAGGSVVHGHAQLLLGRGGHYPRVERGRRDAAAYRSNQGPAADYFDDLVALHRDLGLVSRESGGVAVLAHLTPVKEREVLVIGRAGMDERDPAFTDAVARTVIAFRDVLEVHAFNLALHRPPLDEVDGAASPQDWAQIPPIVHVVDRGDPSSAASDIGSMELYAASVIGADPLDVAGRLRAAIASD